MSETAFEISYPDLPVAKRRDDILAAMRGHQVVVVVGETGSGKTTQLPKMALELAVQSSSDALIGCTQPRRIAASSVAKRVGEEMATAGHSADMVGFKVRFTDTTAKETRLKFMTDGILLAETQGDPLLKKYDTIIIDEAHERSLNIDFLLGLLLNLLQQRKDLRVVISSATLDAGGFVKFFSEGLKADVPLVEVEGRTFPVETHYLPEEREDDLSSHVARAVEWISSVDRQGDVLVFLPGEREIRECADVLEGRAYTGTEVLPLFARLGMAEQQRIFDPSGHTRRIVLATNVAETSLTIPGIIYVVDSGVARVSRYSPGRQVQRLQIEPISQASARQRKGRCGRVTEGICVRLYDEEDFDQRDEFTDPEIRRSSLAGVILRMKSLGLPNIEDFPLVDPPSPRLIAEGYRTLREIGALDKEEDLTEVGGILSRLPVDPRLARMLYEAKRQRCGAELTVLVAALSLMDVRERPEEKKDAADRAQQKYAHVDSDFLSILRVWADVQTARSGRNLRKGPLRKLCRERFLNFRRVIEWDNLVREITRSASNVLKWRAPELSEKEQEWAHPDVIHKCLLAGAPRQFGRWEQEKRTYRAAGGKEFAIFPGSGLFGGRKHAWLLAMELVETSRLWARRVAKLDPLWVEEVAPHLCALRYHSAQWDKSQGAVYAQEIVMSGGLELARRRVHFGRVDVPAARAVFIREGLLGEGLSRQPKCLKTLAWLKEEVSQVEHKLRRPGGLWSDELVLSFFEEKLPAHICTAKAFWKWQREHEDDLCPALSDVVYEQHAAEALYGYPDSMIYQDMEFTLYYHAAPGERDDGVTLGVHVDQLQYIPDWLLEWGVSGDLPERVRLLIRALPKLLRKRCNPVAEMAQRFADDWVDREPQRSLREELASYLTRHVGELVGTGDILLDRLPEELVTKIWVCDDEGSELAMGNNLLNIQEQLGLVMKERFEEQANAEWEMSGMRSWDCGDVPVEIESGGKIGFPALVDEGKTVGLKVFSEREEAVQSHRSGCVRLLYLEMKDQANFVTKKLPLSWDVKMLLPTTGAQVEDLVRVGAEMALCAGRDALPRDAETFTASAKHARGDWFTQTEKLARGLTQWLTQWREVQEWIDQNKSDRNTGEIADDLEEELGWLMKTDFVWRSGKGHLLNYEQYFQAIMDRIDRIESLPLTKDLEKMDLVRELWVPWYAAWIESPDDAHLNHIGWLLENYRVSLFAPNVSLKGKVSVKVLRGLLEGV